MGGGLQGGHITFDIDDSDSEDEVDEEGERSAFSW